MKNPYSIPGVPKKVSMIDRITIYVCEQHCITVKDIKSTCQKRAIITPRQICMYVLYKYTRSTLDYIGEYYGKDHTTVLYGTKTISGYLETDKKLGEEIDKIIKHFKL